MDKIDKIAIATVIALIAWLMLVIAFVLEII